MIKTKSSYKLNTIKIAVLLFGAALLMSSCTSKKPDKDAVPVFNETAVPTPDGVPLIPTPNPLTADPLADIKRTGGDLPVSRATVAKMLAMAFLDKATIDKLPRYLPFEDTDENAWHDRYINAVYYEGIMLGSGGSFCPDDLLTIEQTQILLDKLDPENEIKIVITDENRNKPISYELWTDLFYTLLENLSGEKTVYEMFGIARSDIVVLVTSDTYSGLKPYNIVSDTGPLTCAGYDMNEYIDKGLSVYKKDGEIIAVLGVYSEMPKIYNALITKKTDGYITVFSGGAERTYAYATADMAQGDICDITISGKTAVSVTVYGEKITGTIKKVTNGIIELDETGVLPLNKSFKIYSVATGEASWKYSSNLTVGTDIAEFVIKNGEVAAAIITKAAPADYVRVVLSVTGYKGYIHDSVSITSESDFTVIGPDGTKEYKAGEVFSLEAPDLTDIFEYGRYTVKPANPDGKLQINSIKRSWTDSESPKYRGIIEVSREIGGYAVVNEVSIEEYLYAVVPSEIPTSFGLEASKVQSITARSYAYNQFYANRYASYGANIDDSVNCQVYNNIAENSNSIEAVNATKGMYLGYKGSIISANFFSTSAGVTANSGEVWASSKVFPTATAEYLTSVIQYTEGNYGDLSVEENAYAFFKNTSIKSYDDAFMWFRWNVTMTTKEVEAAINRNLKTRYNANPNLIKTLTGGGYRSMPIETIGELVDLEVLARGEGGNILDLKIVGTEATIIVSTELNIRYLIPPVQYLSGGGDIILNLTNASTLKNYSLMPSAFYVFDKTFDSNGNLSQITFFGGGNGHGVGMSQNGVKGMIDAGFNWEQILKHYYKGVEIITLD